MRGGDEEGGGDLAGKYIQASHGAQLMFVCCCVVVVVVVDPWRVWNCIFVGCAVSGLGNRIQAVVVRDAGVR